MIGVILLIISLSYKMCCGDQCLFFVPVKTGSLIFGYIIAVISALGTIAFTGVNLYFGVILMFPYHFGERSDHLRLEELRTTVIMTGYLIEFSSSFVCTVLLLVGIYQNKPNYIKTFLIYGMVQVVLLMVFFIIMHCATSFFLAGFFILAYAFIGIYVACLYMVFKVYQLMTGQTVFANPMPSNSGLVFATPP